MLPGCLPVLRVADRTAEWLASCQTTGKSPVLKALAGGAARTSTSPTPSMICRQHKGQRQQKQPDVCMSQGVCVLQTHQHRLMLGEG